MSSTLVEDVLDKVNGIWKACRNVEVHQHRCRRIHICARDMFDAVQDMEGEPGLELAISDIDSTLGHVLQNVKQWGSADNYQALADEEELLARVDAELGTLDGCGRLHVLGLEKQWESAYTKAKARDEADLEEKLLKIAEEPSESEVETARSDSQYPLAVESTPSTAMERLADEGFRRSDHRAINGEMEAEATILDIKTLSQKYNDAVDAVASYYPLSLVPSDLVPVISSITQGPTIPNGVPANHDSRSVQGRSMQKLSHLPYVTISDIKKVENVRYLHDIHDLALQVRLYGGRPMRRSGSIMTYLGIKLEDKPDPDAPNMVQSSSSKNGNPNQVSVQLCQVHPRDTLLHSMMQRRLLQEACTWSYLIHDNIVPFLGICRYLQLEKTHTVALVSPWQARTLSDYISGTSDLEVNHVELATDVAQGLYYLHSHGLHHGGLYASSIFLNEDGRAQIGNFSLCSKFELNPPLNLVVRLMGRDVLRCMAPEYIRGRIFTHKVPYENIPLHRGLVAFIIQGATPAHPSTIANETPGEQGLASSPKRRKTSVYSESISEPGLTEVTVTPPPGHQSHSAVSRGLTGEMWSLLQWCWEYDPRARPTIDMVVQRLEELVAICSVGLKNITAHVRQKTVYPVAMGGQCDIYLGEFLAHPYEKVAMKRPRMFGNCNSEPARKELIREVRLWSKLNHPNILEFYGLYDAGGTFVYMISKWMAHGSAPDYLQKCPDANRHNIVTDALNGLCYLHNLNILHGDLKGTNILVKDDLTACLSDLGLARSISEVTTTSLRGNGSTRYMSAEILLTDDAQGIQMMPVKTLESDVFAFGLVIREILGDELPYANINNIAHLIRIIVCGYPLSRPDNSIAHQWLCDDMWKVIQNATHKDPKARPTAAELQRQISCVHTDADICFASYSIPMDLDSPYSH